MIQTFLYNNPCYKAGKKIRVRGIMLHSVGCNQPSAEAFVKNWNTVAYSRACVHAFIDANTGEVYQTLPWNHRGWHCGGSGNDTHIGVEMCEPSSITYTSGASFKCKDLNSAKAAAKRTYDAAVKLFAELCKTYNLDPITSIASHSEGYKRGIASGHADPEHLWKGLGLNYTMNTFRKEVSDLMSNAETSDNTKTIWDFLKAKGLNDYAVAGIMGNLNAESGLNPKNLQNSFEKRLGMNDNQYTAAVDNGTYKNFANDSAGYGLCQWTFHTRKANLYNFMRERGCSIGDLIGQLEFFWKELQGYTGLMKILKNADSIKKASDAILLGFEKPADQSEAVKEKRLRYSETYYNKYHTADQKPSESSYLVEITTDKLRIREKPDMDSEITGYVNKREIYTIVAEHNGWGKLKSGKGWISLQFTKRRQ